ncbi:MAG: hypothetical protein GY750_13865 [Lentisphaerae bacterium]|nr:hypothetical protein [Lentisphaerota bacterium]MCP4102489.1 hypothetical protein [Lentisphaerota bacterium]
MSNEFVKEFYTLCQGQLTMYDAFFYATRLYINSRSKWIKDYEEAKGPKGIFFNPSATKKNIKCISEIHSIVKSSQNINFKISELKRKKEQLSSKGKALALVEAFIKTAKNNGKPPVCCCCSKDNSFHQVCDICHNIVCSSCLKSMPYFNANLLPRSINNIKISCQRCCSFLKDGVSVVLQFINNIYNKYDYFILAQKHAHDKFSGTSFMYQLINNQYVRDIVVFNEMYYQEGQFRNYTEIDEAMNIFVDQMDKSREQHVNYKNDMGSQSSFYYPITNILEQYISNKAAYITNHIELDFLAHCCKVNKVPACIFDNEKTFGGYEKYVWELKRLAANKIIAKRIKREVKRNQMQKGFIPIGFQHVQGRFALQQYLSRSCVINCTEANKFKLKPIKQTPNQIPHYQLHWPNMFKFPFLPQLKNLKMIMSYH